MAVGACACTGGVFAGSYACIGPVSAVVPVDVTVPGCLPPPVNSFLGSLTPMVTWQEARVLSNRRRFL
ncbi:NADH ubiquinone oxidoreductase 20 kDa subunit [Hyphomicrobium denitrificans 1NES1]|uniref:NADH ubiquinone oxidoreductase 20 kDa subunit n=1 Tax=Hyphomicrobium denitrificans 1NES1 TaxID=670307 RepID=N0B209_9HYPH|nr:NADH ubiquinone oxidoreductase 20 kDa subunit [Hyphomicrobium denitrificans 1NES1]